MGALLFVSSEMVPRSFEMSLLDRYMLTSCIYMLLVLLTLILETPLQQERAHGLIFCAVLAIAHLTYFIIAAIVTWNEGRKCDVDPIERFLRRRHGMPTLECARMHMQ